MDNTKYQLFNYGLFNKMSISDFIKKIPVELVSSELDEIKIYNHGVRGIKLKYVNCALNQFCIEQLQNYNKHIECIKTKNLPDFYMAAYTEYMKKTCERGYVIDLESKGQIIVSNPDHWILFLANESDGWYERKGAIYYQYPELDLTAYKWKANET